MAKTAEMKEYTLLYVVTFTSYAAPDPSRLGTAEKVAMTMQVWAKNADEAIAEAKRIAEKERQEWTNLLSVDVVNGVLLEKILNDPLNDYGFAKEKEEEKVNVAI